MPEQETTEPPQAPAAPKTGVLDRIDALIDEGGLLKDGRPRPGSVEPIPAKAATPPPPPEPDLVIDGEKVEMPAEIKSAEGKKNWGYWKGKAQTKLATLEKQVQELSTKVNGAGATQDTTAWETKIAAIEKEKAELADKLGQANLEATPEFQQHYVAKLTEAVEEAKVIVGPELAEKVASILATPDGPTRREQINALEADLSPMQVAELATIVRDIRKINAEKSKAISTWKEQVALRDKTYKERNERERGAHMGAFDSVLPDTAKELVVFEPREGDEAWNSRVKSAIDAARDFHAGKGTAAERAKIALQAQATPILIQQLIKAQDEMTKLIEENKTLKSKRPGMDGGAAAPRNDAPNPNIRESIAERVARLAHEAGAVK